jgi:hypothetical protein
MALALMLTFSVFVAAPPSDRVMQRCTPNPLLQE